MSQTDPSGDRRPSGPAGLDELWADIRGRMGVCPSFFRLASADPPTARALFDLAKLAYLDGPLPALFKETLFTHLSRFCPVRYCVARHAAFLTGRGHVAGDPAVPALSAEQVAALLSEPLPDTAELSRLLAELESAPAPLPDWPEPGSPAERLVRTAATQVFREPSRSRRWGGALSRLLGPARYEQLMLFLAFVRTAHFWSEVHPELEPEADVRELLAEHEALAGPVLDGADAEPARRSATVARLEDEVAELRRAASAAEHLLKREAEFAEQRRLHQTVTDNATLALFIMDDRQRCVFMNPAAEALTGYAFAEVRGRSLHDVVHHTRPDGSHYPLSECPIDRAFPKNDREQGEEVFVHRDGRFYPVAFTASPVRGSDGRPVGTVVEVRDITGQKRAEQELRESEERARRIIDNTLAFVGLMTPDGTLIEANRTALRAGGIERGDVIGRKFWDAPWWSYDPQVQERLRAAVAEAASGRVVRYDVTVRMAGDTRMPIDFMIAPVRDDAGRITHLIPSAVDITDRKAAEDALREADRRKDRFLATLAHELRNPLAPVRAALEILHAAGDDPAAAEAAADARAVMDRQIGHMVRLIDDLLDVARISTGRIVLQRRRVDLAEVVGSAVETARPLLDKMGHRLTVTLPEPPVAVDGDPTRLAQVFANLLNNAAKYTDPGGHVRIAAGCEGGQAVVRVADDGIGIPADRLAGVFEMFHQVEGTAERSHKGLGVGLAVVRGLVELHGGRVEAASAGPGRGSEFTVRLPALAPADAGAGAGGARTNGAGRVRLRVLVVDDNPDITAMQATMLRILGHEVRTAGDGVEAVAAAGDFRPDVVLMDVGMPRMDGHDAARAIRARDWGRRMLLVALTGWGQDDDRRRSSEAGFDRHLTKPVDFGELKKLLAEAAPRAVAAGT